MRKKIFKSVCLIFVIAAAAFAALSAGAVYLTAESTVKRQSQRLVEFVAGAVSSSGADYLKELKYDDQIRITYLTPEGDPIFDSQADAENMDNHIGRPEIESAIKYGAGESQRLSDTFRKETYYYAIRLDDGSILRAAHTNESFYALIAKYLGYAILITLLITLLLLFQTNRISKKIVEPINNLDLENPLENDAYDELAPLLRRIHTQNQQIRQSMEAFNRKQAEISIITRRMEEGLILLDMDGKIISMNPSAAGIFEAEPERSAGASILTLNHSKKMTDALSLAQNGSNGEFTFKRGDKSYQVRLSPAKGDDDSYIGIVALILDASQKRKGEQMRREFSANVSHELKTPIQSISGYAELLMNGMVKPEDTQRFSALIYNESQRLIALINDIIKLSRLDESDSRMDFERTDLLELAREVADALSASARKAGVEMEIKGQPCEIMGSRAILYELIYNLTDNAVRYNKPGGKATIETIKTKNSCVLAVSDTGIGIPAEHHDRVFERFYRVDKSHSRQNGGTGLGLSIVKHAAALHNAKLSLESKEGAGAKITVIFAHKMRT